jgi:hypothetical protein
MRKTEMEEIMKRATVLIVGACILSAWPLVAQGPLAEESSVDPQGYLYGTVETKSGTSYKGTLRWGREESFWDDHFNAGKTEMPFQEARPEGERERRRIKILGITISYGNNWDESRQFIARFGDIRSIEREGRRGVFVTMKGGDEYEIDDSSNDVGASITVDDASLGRVKLVWDRIEKITFSPAPADLQPKTHRLYGVLKTASGEFTGFVQWDLEECLSTDELDGEGDDGDLSIPMGTIAAIEKNNRNGAWVELKDGRRLLLEDTNDVDDSTSGIFVEDERLGRVKVAWDEFERVDFTRTRRTGRGYDDYPALGALKGTVTDVDGNTSSGEIVIDLDESRGWEILNGELDEIAYNIPLATVRSLEPTSRDQTRVVLRNGEELVLEEATDVSDDNDGVVVITGGSEKYIAWRDVERIEFQ